MKINQIPDIYIEQYLLDELPENLRKEMDELILENPVLNDRISEFRKSNEEILALYPAHYIAAGIIEKNKIKKNISAGYVPELKRAGNKNLLPGIISARTESIKNYFKRISSIPSQRYTLSFASAAIIALVVVFMMPGIRNTDRTLKPYDDTVRIKGLDSKLLLYRMKGSEVEELGNSSYARKGDILQVGYIATGNYRYGVIVSIDGRGAVTLHLPDANIAAGELTANKRILLNKSYELDDSPSFERFIMVLSAEPVNASGIVEKAKKLAISRDSALNGLIDAGKNSVEFSITIKKTE